MTVNYRMAYRRHCKISVQEFFVRDTHRLHIETHLLRSDAQSFDIHAAYAGTAHFAHLRDRDVLSVMDAYHRKRRNRAIRGIMLPYQRVSFH
jgi:hypothetical protein